MILKMMMMAMAMAKMMMTMHDDNGSDDSIFFQRNCDSILVSPMREEELKDNAMVNIILYHHPTIHQLKQACFGEGVKKRIYPTLRLTVRVDDHDNHC